MTKHELLVQAYAAFNARDIDRALALMRENVSWPKASEGGRVVGGDALRAYWTRQWSEFDPRVDVLDIVETEHGATVAVRQLVKNHTGDVLSDTVVRHTYTIANGLIERMDLAGGAADAPSAAFATE